jgi:hypothetical protein
LGIIISTPSASATTLSLLLLALLLLHSGELIRISQHSKTFLGTFFGQFRPVLYGSSEFLNFLGGFLKKRLLPTFCDAGLDFGRIRSLFHNGCNKCCNSYLEFCGSYYSAA